MAAPLVIVPRMPTAQEVWDAGFTNIEYVPYWLMDTYEPIRVVDHDPTDRI